MVTDFTERKVYVIIMLWGQTNHNFKAYQSRPTTNMFVQLEFVLINLQKTLTGTL